MGGQRRYISLGRMIVLILIGVAIAVIVYTVDLLLDHRVNTGIAIAVIVASVLSVLWNASILGRKSR